MRIFNWVQNKIYGKQEKKVSNSTSAFTHTLTSNSRKEEFDDWPQTLLAIGTLGDNKMKEDTSRNEPDFQSEEVVNLQKELTKLLTQKPKPSSDESERGKEGRANLPLNRFLTCPSILDDNLGNDDDSDLSTDTKIILTKAKDLLAENKSGIRNTSLKFLLKKMFVCHSGFVPTPSMRDPLPEPRMEKILRAMLHKKIYPQTTTKKYMDRQPSVKKYLENKPKQRFHGEEMEEEKGEESSKWVKTDSEYIVLEI